MHTYCLPTSCKIKQLNIETVSVFKGGKYPEVQVAKYAHSLQEGQMTRAGKQYVCIQFSITPNIVWGNMWKPILGRWKKKGIHI